MATIFRDVVYGNHPNQKVNLYQPDNYDFITDLGRDLKGVVLWIHGGGWAGGSKDVNKINFRNYFLSEEISAVQALADNNSLDDDACQILADIGFFVVSANYRLISTGNPSNSVAALNTGGGEFPANVEDIRELYKYMTFPNYGIGVNAPTWQLIVRYTQTFGLLVIGGSAGGHLAVAGVFEGAGNTGKWPRGLCNVVGPMNIFSDETNPIGAIGRDLIGRYTGNLVNNQKLGSPWWKRNSASDPNNIGYENYLGFSDTSNPDISHNRMKMWFLYNQNDVLVPLTSIEPFIEWARSAVGNNNVSSTKIDVRDPNSLARYRGIWNNTNSYTGGSGIVSDHVLFSGRMYKANRAVPIGTAPTDPPDNFNWSYGEDSTHNLPPNQSLVNWVQDAAKFVYYSEINFPKLQHRLRPTQGVMYPRVKNINYNPPPPSYTLTADSSSVNEGSTATFTLRTRGVAPNTVLYFTISGVSAADITGGSTSGTVTTNLSGQGIISIGLVADSITEGPETLTVTVRTGSTSGPSVASASITVNDTSRNNETLSISPTTVNLSQTFTTSSTGGVPNTNFSITWTRNGVFALSGTSTLDGNGNTSVPGSFQQSGNWVLTVNYAGSGNTRTANLTVNPESLTLPASVQASQLFTVSISGGNPNTGFSLIWFRSGVQQLSGSSALNSNGAFSDSTASLTPAGAYTLQVTLPSSGNVISRSVNVLENLSISPSQVSRNQSFTVTSSGGVPNTGFTLEWRRNGIQVITGSATLDAGGNFSAPGSFADAGFYTLTVRYTSTGNAVSANLNVV
jgi:acetyl esterase/lipase